MKTLASLILLAIAELAMAAQPPSDQPISLQSQQPPADASTVVDEAPAPALRATPAEFIIRTTAVAKQQAESEVHYETQRRVQRVFSRLFSR